VLCKKIIAVKSKAVKSRRFNSSQIWQNLLRKAMAQKRAVFSMMMIELMATYFEV
jgi:hypothetical protein